MSTISDPRPGYILWNTTHPTRSCKSCLEASRVAVEHGERHPDLGMAIGVVRIDGTEPGTFDDHEAEVRKATILTVRESYS